MKHDRTCSYKTRALHPEKLILLKHQGNTITQNKCKQKHFSCWAVTKGLPFAQAHVHQLG